MQAQDLASAFVDEELAPRYAPGRLPTAYALATAQAAGHFQMLFRRRRGDELRLRLRHRCRECPTRNMHTLFVALTA